MHDFTRKRFYQKNHRICSSNLLLTLVNDSGFFAGYFQNFVGTKHEKEELLSQRNKINVQLE